MIYINPQSGPNNMFLEYVCNKWLSATDTQNSLESKYFSVKKYFPGVINSKIISINVLPSDMLVTTMIGMSDIGNYELDNNTLEIDTFNKLNNKKDIWWLESLIRNYFKDSRLEGYNLIKDETWPEITSIQEFESLPEEIKSECIGAHGLKLHTLSPDSPNCPRRYIRDSLRSKFKQAMPAVIYESSNDIYRFPFSSIFNTPEFEEQLYKIAEWAGLVFLKPENFVGIHNEFLSKQVYKNASTDAEALLTRILNYEQFEIPQMNVVMEGYIDNKLELHYNKELVWHTDTWFKHSREIYDYFL